MKPRQAVLRVFRIAAAVSVICALGSWLVGAQEMDWLPTVDTHAWSRFGLRAWKEVRLTTHAYDESERLVRSSTTVARTRLTRVGPRSYTLSVSSTVAAAGREFPSPVQTITRNVVPDIQTHQVVGEETLVVSNRQISTRIIRYVTSNGTRQESHTLYWNSEVVPQVLKRVTFSVDQEQPDAVLEVSSTVTALDVPTEVLGERKCGWSVSTVITQRDKTITIEEVNCHDVPGELVSQVTEERDQNGMLLSRKELEVVGYGYGRPRRLLRRQR